MGFSAPNYTQVPNEFLDIWMPILGKAETKVLLVIFRKTFGWHKRQDRISLSQFEKLTGLERTHVCRAVRGLIAKGLINKILIGENGIQETYYELVIKEDSNNSYQCLFGKETSVAKVHTKETLTKEIIQSPSAPPLSCADATQEARPTSKTSKKIFPVEAKEMADLLFSQIQKLNPDHKKPNFVKWAESFDLLQRRDGRTWTAIKEMILWASEHVFWAKQILSPDNLRKHWDKMTLQMKPLVNRGAISEKNRELAYKIKTFLAKTGEQGLLSVNQTFAANTRTGDSINYDLPENTFREIIFKWFGIKGESKQ